MNNLLKVGKFNNVSGAFRVSDPCYEKDTRYAGVVDNCLVGEWEAYVAKLEVVGWGSRVATLVVRAVGGLPSGVREQLPFEVGVDSGQAGVFEETKYGLKLAAPVVCHGDKEYGRHTYLAMIGSYRSLLTDPDSVNLMDDIYKRRMEEIELAVADYDAKPPGTTDDFYDACCNFTLSDLGAGTMEFAAVSRTGFGDGLYTAYATRDAQGRVVEIEIDFGLYEPEETLTDDIPL